MSGGGWLVLLGSRIHGWGVESRVYESRTRVLGDFIYSTGGSITFGEVESQSRKSTVNLCKICQ